MRDMSESSMDQLWEYAGSMDDEDRACALRELGRRKMREKELHRGEELLRASSALWKELDQQLEFALTEYALGSCLIRMGEYAKAEEAYESAVFGFQFNGFYGYLPDAEYWIGEARYGQKKYEQAIDSYDLAIRQYPSYAHMEIAAARNSLGIARTSVHDPMLASGEFFVAHEEFNLAEEFEEAAAAWVRHAISLSDTGWYDIALKALKQGIETYEYMGNEQEVAYTQQYLGITLMLTGQFLQAIEYLEKSVTACKKNNDTLRAAESEIHIAKCLAKLGEPDKATEKLDRLESAIEVLGNGFSKAQLLFARGVVTREKTLWTDAITVFEQCRSHCEKEGYTRFEWTTMIELYELYLLTNRLDDAYDLDQKYSGADFGTLGPICVAFNICRAEYSLRFGHFDDAAASIREAISDAKVCAMPEKLKRARSLQRKITAAKKAAA